MVKSTQRQLRGLGAPANDRPAFQHKAVEASLRLIASRDQTIMCGPNDDNVIAGSRRSLRHGERRKGQGRNQRRPFHKSASSDLAHLNASFRDARKPERVRRACLFIAYPPTFAGIQIHVKPV